MMSSVFVAVALVATLIDRSTSSQRVMVLLGEGGG
jgi:hypothetical protein